jgi:uncharacterized protein with HEPN domain
MSHRDDMITLRQMRDHAREAMGICSDKSFVDIKRDRVLQLALVRLVEIVGEAAGRVSPETRDQYADLPWQGMIGMRNRLIHGYDAINLEILWNTIQFDLPELVELLDRILPSEPNQ